MRSKRVCKFRLQRGLDAVHTGIHCVAERVVIDISKRELTLLERIRERGTRREYSLITLQFPILIFRMSGS